MSRDLEAPENEPRPTDPPSGPPVVGIGASAGGLDALKRMLAAAERGVGAAFLIVQHLDPTHPSMLANLLARHAAIPVREARNGERPEANAALVAPPGQLMRLIDGRVALEAQTAPRVEQAPIDTLFASLAEALGERAICVVLSGTGGDGAQGLRAVKAAGGCALVQRGADARFEGMPNAALGTDLVDAALDAEDIPARVAALIGVSAPPAQADRGLEETAPQTFAAILDVIRATAGHDFTRYKRGTLNRRIRRRMALTGAETPEAYLERLKENAGEVGVLTKDVLIGVTRFFRDPDSWEALAQEAIEPAIAALSDGEALRVWTSGCATGEEAYTLGMTALDCVDRSGRDIRLQVFATDVNPDAIAFARKGRYAASAGADIPPRFRTYVVQEEGGLRIGSRLRDRVVFATQNAVADPPFSGLDVITCRNLLIYLDASAQSHLIDTLCFALKPGGFLMLGHSESAAQAADALEPRSKRHRIYRRKGADGKRADPVFRTGGGAGRAPSAAAPAPAPQIPMDGATRAMLARFAPPAALVGAEFGLLGLHGDVAPFLDLRPGELTGGLVSLVAEPLRARLWNALKAAARTGETAEAMIDATSDGPGGAVRLIVEPLQDGRDQRFIVYFLRGAAPADAIPTEDEAESPPGAGGDPARLRAELEATRRELQDTIARAETSEQELQAANEEVMSANEELQSSNEELETSREELQSLNEELGAINSQLEEKVDLLEAAHDDLANLIASSDIATIFLDTELRVRRFSERARLLAALEETDIGRPLGTFAIRADDPGLIADAREVLASLAPREAEIADAEGRIYLRRITPYRTRDDRIGGVVIACADVSGLRVAAARLESQAERQRSIGELGELALGTEDLRALLDRAVGEISTILDAPLVEARRLSDDGARFTLVAGVGWARGLVGDASTAREASGHLDLALSRSGALRMDDLKAERRFEPPQILRDHDAETGVAAPVGPAGGAWGVLAAFRDTARPFSEEEGAYLQSVAHILSLAVGRDRARRAQEGERRALRRLMDGLPILIGVVDRRLRFEICNRAFEALGWTAAELEGASVAETFGDTVFQSLAPAFASAFAGAPATVEIALAAPSEKPRAYQAHCAPRGEAGAEPDGVFFAAVDVTERKTAEERNAVISAELDHRVKNILALVGTIARITGRRATSVESFTRAFDDRIGALARAHDLLSDTSWTGVSLRDLVQRELAAYAEERGRVRVEGPEVELTPQAAQSLSLALHELTTNAVKYGALAEPEGVLELGWTLEDGRLTLRWRERIGRPATPPAEEGFGGRILRAAAPRQLGGEATLDYGKDGFAYTLVCPATVLKRRTD